MTKMFQVEIQVESSWVKIGTDEEIKAELGPDFDFAGPGLYLTNTDTLLIIPKNRPLKDLWNILGI